MEAPAIGTRENDKEAEHAGDDKRCVCTEKLGVGVGPCSDRGRRRASQNRESSTSMLLQEGRGRVNPAGEWWWGGRVPVGPGMPCPVSPCGVVRARGVWPFDDSRQQG